MSRLVRIQKGRGPEGLFLVMATDRSEVILAPFSWEKGISKDRIRIYEAHTVMASVEENLQFRKVRA